MHFKVQFPNTQVLGEKTEPEEAEKQRDRVVSPNKAAGLELSTTGVYPDTSWLLCQELAAAASVASLKPCPLQWRSLFLLLLSIPPGPFSQNYSHPTCYCRRVSQWLSKGRIGAEAHFGQL